GGVWTSVTVSPSASCDPLSIDAGTAAQDAPVDTTTFLQRAVGGELKIAFTLLLLRVLPRMSTKLACSTSVPNTELVKLKEACPDPSVFAPPVSPTFGPLVTVNVTGTPACPTSLASTTVAVTVAFVPVRCVCVGGASEMPDAGSAHGRPSGLNCCFSIRSKTVR